MLAWMDLEMTGLDPDKDKIVEVATIITDDQLEIVAEGPDIVIHVDDDTLATMNDVVRSMHEKSGLTQAIRSSHASDSDALQQTLSFLQSHIKEARTVPLCGNSIGTDRRFLAKHWPEIEDFLHYRSIDVSTLKELARRWNVDVLNNAPKKSTTHRALDDIRESITELRYYKENFLR